MGLLSVLFLHTLLPSRGFSIVSHFSLFCFRFFLRFLWGHLLLLVVFSSFLVGHGTSFLRGFSLLIGLVPLHFGSSLCVTTSAPVGVPFRASSAYSSCSFLRDSVESQFLRVGVLPPGRVFSVRGVLPSLPWFRFLSACLWYTSSSG